jgi:hypothetical protein
VSAELNEFVKIHEAAMKQRIAEEKAHARQYSLKGPVFIYALIDPETDEPRYIGKSIRPFERLTNHMNEKAACHRTHWLQSLKRKGLRPILVILEGLCGEWPWEEAERYWIARLRQQGAPLVNGTSGGDGVPDISVMAPDSYQRMKQTWKGRKHTPEAIQNLKNRPKREHSPAERALMSAKMRDRYFSPEHRQHLSQANSKLSDHQVRDICSRLEHGARVIDLAREFKVHRTTISKIKMGTYSPVTGQVARPLDLKDGQFGLFSNTKQ